MRFVEACKECSAKDALTPDRAALVFAAGALLGFCDRTTDVALRADMRNLSTLLLLSVGIKAPDASAAP